MWGKKKTKAATAAVIFPALEDPMWDKKLQALRERLATTLPDDALLVGILGLLDANLRVELGPLTDGGVSDAEVHRLRGRIGMVRDLKGEIEKLWHEARQKAGA